MTTRMIHPLHGATHAYGEGDIARHKALGWEVEVTIGNCTKAFDPSLPVTVGETIVIPAPDSYEPATPRYEEKRKPGRPPKAK